ncbi:hypothetical protein HK104_006845 [Borealophlyctis nickersoniae]|nr:hypothetical protein HK104_006845 [Borealophlyctis nickersoniae]
MVVDAPLGNSVLTKEDELTEAKFRELATGPAHLAEGYYIAIKVTAAEVADELECISKIETTGRQSRVNEAVAAVERWDEFLKSAKKALRTAQMLEELNNCLRKVEIGQILDNSKWESVDPDTVWVNLGPVQQQQFLFFLTLGPVAGGVGIETGRGGEAVQEAINRLKKMQDVRILGVMMKDFQRKKNEQVETPDGFYLSDAVRKRLHAINKLSVVTIREDIDGPWVPILYSFSGYLASPKEFEASLEETSFKLFQTHPHPGDPAHGRKRYHESHAQNPDAQVLTTGLQSHYQPKGANTNSRPGITAHHCQIRYTPEFIDFQKVLANTNRWFTILLAVAQPLDFLRMMDQAIVKAMGTHPRYQITTNYQGSVTGHRDLKDWWWTIVHWHGKWADDGGRWIVPELGLILSDRPGEGLAAHTMFLEHAVEPITRMEKRTSHVISAQEVYSRNTLKDEKILEGNSPALDDCLAKMIRRIKAEVFGVPYAGMEKDGIYMGFNGLK